MSSSLVTIPSSLVARTVDELRSATVTERVLLWLGERRPPNEIWVTDVFVPQQYAECDYFQIPRAGIEELLSTLRARRWMVVAQVHTHPEQAFHSQADNRWAIVRHEGALSLVVPHFCQRTSSTTFVGDAMVFRVNARGGFTHVDSAQAYRVVP